MDMQVQTDFTQVPKLLPALRPLLHRAHPFVQHYPLQNHILIANHYFHVSSEHGGHKGSVGGAVYESGKRKR